MLIFSPHSRSSSRSKFKAGFTLIELLVVMAVMVIITGAILVRQSGFNSSTLLRSLGYSVALSLRQAQVYGTSVYGTSTLAGGGALVYAQGYGVSFSSGDLTHYVLFADFGGGPYDYTTSLSRQVKLFTLGSGFSIKSFCGTLAGGSRHCSTDATPLTYLSIVFKRPNPDALFYGSDGGAYTAAYIQIRSTDGVTRGITVSQSGQIVVGAVGT